MKLNKKDFSGNYYNFIENTKFNMKYELFEVLPLGNDINGFVKSTRPNSIIIIIERGKINYL